MMTAAIILVILKVIFFLILSIRGKFYFQNHRNKLPEILPLVSILVPARNEEKHLPALLSSLSKLDYPEEKLQVLLADDQSSDGTSEIMKTWCDRPSRTFFLSKQPTPFGSMPMEKRMSSVFWSKKRRENFCFLRMQTVK
jgi:cellulose synthase/poly-beta-1,6-N-acetylglucosamine synthase-like glycosyltransferase